MEQLQLIDMERRLERIERLLRAVTDETRSARVDLGLDRSRNDRWARMMLGVLDELDREGGEVSRRRFLEISGRHAFGRGRGVAGFYQQLVEPAPGFRTRLTPAGRERLRLLRERYGDG